jgi:hypothetical protein
MAIPQVFLAVSKIDATAVTFFAGMMNTHGPCVVSALFGTGFVRRKLKRLFEYRHHVTRDAMRVRSIPHK